MNNIYIEMCKISPVQKELEYDEQLFYCLSHDRYDCDCHISHGSFGCEKRDIISDYPKHYIVKPRQEDWQEICSEYFTRVRRSCNMWRDFKDFCSIPGCIPSYIKDGKFSERLTIIWCLFVHKELWNLTWSWEEKKWKKIQV